jgi:hypothetical protein
LGLLSELAQGGDALFWRSGAETGEVQDAGYAQAVAMRGFVGWVGRGGSSGFFGCCCVFPSGEGRWEFIALCVFGIWGLDGAEVMAADGELALGMERWGGNEWERRDAP